MESSRLLRRKGDVTVLSPKFSQTGERSRLAASEKYVGELDGIRAIAVSFVVIRHYGLLPGIPGGFGVTIFFFLSGYLITTLFYSEYKSTLGINIPQFYLRRWLRLTPALVISVILGVAFHHFTRTAVGGGPVPLGTTMAALFYYSNYYDLYWGLDQAMTIPFGICWSLAVEEHFYLIWPWILRRTIHDPRRLCIIIASLCVGVLIWRCYARLVLALPLEHADLATDSRIDSILFGALLRVLLETRWAAFVVKILRATPCRVAALLALLMTFLVRDDNFRETIRYTIQGLALMPFFTAALSDNPNSIMRRILSSPPMILIGRLSYSIYLFHLLARTPGEVYFGSPYSAGSVISGLVLTGTISFGLYVFVERPIARLRHRLRTHGPSAAGSATDSVLNPPVADLAEKPAIGA